MRGHIRKYEGKKGKSWSVYYFRGYDDMGNKLYTTRRGFKTEKEAETFLSSVTKEINQGTYVEPTKEKFSDFLLSWIDYKRDSVRQRTIEIYQRIIDLHVNPFLGHKIIGDIRPVDLRDFYKHLQRDKNLSKRYISQIHTLLHDAFDRALKWEIITRNIVDAVDSPKPVRKKFQFWSLENTRRFLNSTDVREHRFYIAFLIALTTGMRQGEILALRWKDIELENAKINVTSTITRINGEYTFGPPKSESGEREIYLAPEVVEALKSHKAHQNEERLSLGKGYKNMDLVVARITGGFVSQAFLRMKFTKLIEKLEMPYIRFHDLRHTHASLLLELGEELKVIQEQLGHATIGITADTYTHASKSVKQRPAHLMSNALFGAQN